VLWVKDYIYANYHPNAKADEIMDDIDRRLVIKFASRKETHPLNSIAIVPAFSGLRRFAEGRGFKQWTGDDSKALMKVSQVKNKIM
jgi:hypothetical protein